jgi:hypothetical protein
MRISEKIKQFVSEMTPSIDAQIEATRRYEICINCENKELRDKGEICNLCGCSIKGKIFNPEPQCNKHK